MITEAQLLALAEALIGQHGTDAWRHADGKARDLLARGDHDGHLAWQRIARHIEQLVPDAKALAGREQAPAPTAAGKQRR